jgi:hypothetical protein
MQASKETAVTIRQCEGLDSFSSDQTVEDITDPPDRVYHLHTGIDFHFIPQPAYQYIHDIVLGSKLYTHTCSMIIVLETTRRRFA